MKLQPVTVFLYLLVYLFGCQSADHKNKKQADSTVTVKQISPHPFTELDTLNLFEDEFTYLFIKAILPDSIVLDYKMVNRYIEAYGSPPVKPKDAEYIVTLRVSFEETDFSFLKAQLESVRNKNWDLARLNLREPFIRYRNFFAEQYESDWSKFAKEGFNEHVSISLPLFNKKRNMAIVYVESYCCGLCGSGYMKKYRLTNNQWQEVQAVMLWIS